MYLIFGGERYYAAGGGYDLLGRRESREDAIAFAQQAIGKEGVEPYDEDLDFMEDEPRTTPIEWAHVFDAESGTIIATYGDMPLGGGTMFTGIRERKA